MNLMTLRGLIRKPGNPTMTLDLGNGVPMTIAFQKTPLLEELGKAFNDERTAETGLSYDPETGVLSVDGVVGEAPVTGTVDSDLDDEDPAYIAESHADDEDDDLL